MNEADSRPPEKLGNPHGPLNVWTESFPKVIINRVTSSSASASSSSSSATTRSRVLTTTEVTRRSEHGSVSVSSGKQALDALTQPLLPYSKAQGRSVFSKLLGKLRHSHRTRFRRRRDDDFGIKTIGQFGSFVYLVNQIFGTGVIAIPNVVASSGWLPAIIADGFVCCAAGIGTLMMLRCMTLVKGNRNFEKRLEYMAVMERFLCPPLYNFVQVCFYLSILSSNLASIIVVAQAVDHILVKILSFSVMIQIYPYPWVRVLDTTLLESVYGDKQLTLGITVGYLLTALGCIPLALQTMEENMRVQYVSFTFLICTLGGLCIAAALKIAKTFPPKLNLKKSYLNTDEARYIDSEDSLDVTRNEKRYFSLEEAYDNEKRREKADIDETRGIEAYTPDDGGGKKASVNESQWGGAELFTNPQMEAGQSHISHREALSFTTNLNAHTDYPSGTYIPAFLLLAMLGRRLLRRRRLEHVNGKGRQLSAVVKTPSLFGQSNYGELISTFLASYSFVNTIPSWANEMTWTVDVVAAVKYASVFAFTVYYIFGFMMAFAYPNAHTDNILQAVLADTDRSGWQLFLVYAFDLITVAPGILVYCITMRYNLINSENLTRSQSIFWGAFFPFCLAWLVSNESHFSTLLTWSSLVFSLMVNFIAPCLIFLVACCVSKPSQRNPVYDTRRNALQNFLISTGFQISFWCASEKALEQFVLVDDTEYQFIQLQFRPGQQSSSSLFPLELQCNTSRETPCCVVDLLQQSALREQPDNPFAPSPASLRSPMNPRRLYQSIISRGNTSRLSREMTPLFCRHAIFPPTGNESMSSRLYSSTRRPSQSLSTRNVQDRLMPILAVSPVQGRDKILSPAASFSVPSSEPKLTRPFPGVKRRLPLPETHASLPVKISRLYIWDTISARRQAIMLERRRRRELASADGRGRVGDKQRSRMTYHLVTDQWRKKLRQSYPHMHSWSLSSERVGTQAPGRNALVTQSMSLWPWTDRGDITQRSYRHIAPASVPHSVRSSGFEDAYLRRIFDPHKFTDGPNEPFDCWSECGPAVINSFSQEGDLRENNSHVLTLPPSLEEPDGGDEVDTAGSSIEHSSPQLSTIGSECVFTNEAFRESMKTSNPSTREDIYRPKDDTIDSFRPKPDSDSPRKPRPGLLIPRKRSPPFLSADQIPSSSRSVTCLTSPIRKKTELSLPIGTARKWSPTGIEESTCAGMESDEDSSEGPPPVKGAEDAYEQDEDILGEVKNIRIHVFPKGLLRRNHIEFTVILLFLLTCSCIFTATLRIVDDLSLAG